MSNNKKNQIEDFIEEAERIRKTPISKEGIDRINEAAIQAEIEENEDDQDFEIPVAAKSINKIESVHT